MHYHNMSIQITPSDDVSVSRQSCPDGNNWLWIKESPVKYSILIDGATIAEVDAIVAAINAPILRRREELDAKLAAFRAGHADDEAA